jgi:hypothetical protein
VPGVAEERGKHAACVACRIHAAHIAVLRCRTEFIKWPLQKEII